MASSAWSNLSRHRPAIAAFVGFAAFTSIYYVLYNSEHLYDVPQPTGPTALHRSNAIRRRSRNSQDDSVQTNEETPRQERQLGGLDGNQSPIPIDDAVTEVSIPAQDREGQRINELMFAISKHREQNEGIIHRGVTCDECSRLPITGVRYHCANCADFDLCEDCEATDCHLKTHVFYKIKIPAPWGGKQPVPVWYPGKPRLLPDTIPPNVKENLVKMFAGLETKIDGWYQQFTCLANTPWPADPDNLNLALDRRAFDRCFVPQHSERLFPVPNLIHDRLFATYDSDDNGLIGFSEFVMRNIEIHGDFPEAKKKLVFRGVDLDNDGYISRQDFLKLFRAWHALKKTILVDYMKADAAGEDARSVVDMRDRRDHVLSGRPLTSYFLYERPPFASNPRQGEGKIAEDVFFPVVRENFDDSDTLTRREVVANTWINPYEAVQMDLLSIARGQEAYYLTKDQARQFHGDDTTEDPNWVQQDDIWWVRYRPSLGGGVYVRVADADLPSGTTEFRPVMHDKKQCEDLAEGIVQRLRDNLGQFLNSNANKRLREREKYRQFHLSDEVNSFSTPLGSPDLHAKAIESKPHANIQENGAPSPNSRHENDPITSYQRLSHPIIGGTAAADTIYKVIQEALNELLDPLFKPCETLKLALDDTIEERKELAVELYIQRVGRHAETFLVFIETHDIEVSTHALQMMMCYESIRHDLWHVPDVSPLTGHSLWGKAAFDWFAPVVPTLNYLTETLLKEGVQVLRGLIETSRGHREIVVESSRLRRSQQKQPAADPTMPQHRPQASRPDSPTPQYADVTPKRLDHLLRLDICDRRLKEVGCPPGSLNFDEFAELVGQTDEKGNKLLGFVAGWLDVVMF